MNAEVGYAGMHNCSGAGGEVRRLHGKDHHTLSVKPEFLEVRVHQDDVSMRCDEPDDEAP